MAFVNLSLLFGGLLAAVPVVLHLLMRPRPKHQVFPAVRFIQQRQQANTRRLQLRHWLLLALRCAAILLVAAALARPSVASAAVGGWVAAGLLAVALAAVGGILAVALARRLSRTILGGLGAAAAALGVTLLVLVGRLVWGGSVTLGSQEAPVAAALVIDASPRMEYRHENRTRLELARDLGTWLLEQFPEDSQVAVLDTRAGGAAFAIDRAAAALQLDRLRPSGAPRPLLQQVAQALRLIRQSELDRKEVYIFTDLAAPAWSGDEAAELQQTLADSPNTLLYVVDVGAERPRNLALGDLDLSAALLPESGELRIATELRSVGLAGERTIELLVENYDPRLPVMRDGEAVLPTAQRRGTQQAAVPADGSQRVELRLRGLEQGVHQGRVRLVGEDGLAVDDVRHFTVAVQPAWPVLVVSGPGVSPQYLVEAIAPREFRQTNQARFECRAIDQPELAGADLASYRAVALLDPAPLPEETWDKLAAYVEEGGGLAIFLGHNAQSEPFSQPVPQRLLGGKLVRQTRSGGDLYLAPRSLEHPVLAALRQVEANVPWDRFPVYYHWNLDDLAPASRAILHYGNNRPALVETPLGRGRSVVMTTPITDPLRPRGRPAWNELAAGEDAWPCFVLVNELMLHLVASSDERLNYRCGETAVLGNDPVRFPERYQLFTPLDEPQDVLARDERLVIRFTDNPGAYRLRGQRNGPVVRGFAVNLPAAATDLARVPRERLDEILGGGRYRLARSQEEIDRAVGNDRVGSEFYPLLIALVALVLGLEHVLANRFYRPERAAA